jgi:hypothetical protein
MIDIARDIAQKVMADLKAGKLEAVSFPEICSAVAEDPRKPKNRQAYHDLCELTLRQFVNLCP